MLLISVSRQNVSMIVSLGVRWWLREAMKHRMSRARRVVQASGANGRAISRTISTGPNILMVRSTRGLVRTATGVAEGSGWGGAAAETFTTWSTKSAGSNSRASSESNKAGWD